MAASVNPSVFGQSVTFTATVAPVPPATVTPTGTVSFYDTSTTPVSLLGSASLSGGVATFSTAALAVGTHSIIAAYGGDANFLFGTSPALSQVVNPAATTTAVASSLNPSVYGQAVSFTATVSAVAPGAGTPTGPVTFFDGAASLGSAPLSAGAASLTTSTLVVGSHAITAAYGGDVQFTGSTSAPITQTVGCTNHIIVVNTNDTGPGSLRWAITNVCANGTITFDAALNGQTIVLTSGELVIDNNLTITGPGADQLAISGNHTSRVFSATLVEVTLSGLTITEGNGVGPVDAGLGGAIYSIGQLTIRDCRLVGNRAALTGGAIALPIGSLILERTTVARNECPQVAGISIQDGVAFIRDCTISGNGGLSGDALRVNAVLLDATIELLNSTVSGNTTTNDAGAAITVESSSGRRAYLTLQNSTVTSNAVTQAGQPGAIYLRPGGGSNLLTLNNSIVAGNHAGGVPADLTGLAATNSSYNLIGTGGGLTSGVKGNQVGINNPEVGPLADNGGPTFTHALLTSSPAIDAGGNTTAAGLLTDQRGPGFPRILNATVDIGAYESGLPVLSVNCAALRPCHTNQADALADVLAHSTASGGCCSNVTVTAAVTGGSAADPVITVTASDCCGNLDRKTCTANVDTTPPLITGCPTGPLALPCGAPPTCADARALLTVSDNADPNPTLDCQGEPVVTNGCQRSQTFRVTVTDHCNNASSCAVAYTWTVDATPPVFTRFPADAHLPCNPAALPECNLSATNVEAQDSCGPPVITCQRGPDLTNGCLRTRTLTYTATDGCNNSVSRSQTLTWTASATPPVFTNCPASRNLGCNPANIPECDPGVGATAACGVASVSCAMVDATNDCVRARTLTYTAVDACNNSNTCTQVLIWSVQPPPVLSLELQKTNLSVVLSWPVTCCNTYALEATTSLNPPITWGPASGQVLVINGRNVVSVPLGAGNQFYRLKSP